MKTSELIKQLQESVEVWGDLPVIIETENDLSKLGGIVRYGYRNNTLSLVIQSEKEHANDMVGQQDDITILPSEYKATKR
jgi:hypothetical protein